MTTSLLDITTSLLKRVAAENDETPRSFFFGSMPAQIFDSAFIPGISIEDYIERLVKFSKCSNESVMIALIYLEKAALKVPSCRITSFNVHRLFLTALVVASKWHEDLCYGNTDWAKIGGVELEELNRLERTFLFDVMRMEGLHVSPELFQGAFLQVYTAAVQPAHMSVATVPVMPVNPSVAFV